MRPDGLKHRSLFEICILLGVVVKASASQLVDLGVIPLVESYQRALKMVFTVSLLGAQYFRDVV